MIKFKFMFNERVTDVEMEEPNEGKEVTSKLVRETGNKIEQTVFKLKGKDGKLFLSVTISIGTKCGERGTKIDWQTLPMPIVDYDCGLTLKEVNYGTIPTEAPADRSIK